MKKVEELERPMICPFRSETHYNYANIDGSAIVIDAQTETFPECYGNQCPLYKYEVGRGFYCAQADTMGAVQKKMSEQMKLSIIIPTYNAEPYLAELLIVWRGRCERV